MKSKDQILLEKEYLKVFLKENNYLENERGLDDHDLIDDEHLHKMAEDVAEEIAYEASNYAENRPYLPDIEAFIEQSVKEKTQTPDEYNFVFNRVWEIFNKISNTNLGHYS